MNLVIVDLDCGNTGSVAMAFERFGLEPTITSDAVVIVSADRVVLPGVGSATFAMQRIKTLGLTGPLRTLQQPTLGICLGMQLLFERSEESDAPCLGVIEGTVRRLEPQSGMPVPHMGWSRLTVRDDSTALRSGDYVYFAHSYACDDGPCSVATAEYGRAIPAVVRHANYLGAQFHPERSGEAGARFLKGFIAP